MNQVTDHGRQVVAQIASAQGLSETTVMGLLHALQRGHGTAAQFDQPELGGMGQWSKGGMTQIGDMFNDALTQKVDATLTELARHLNGRDLFTQASTSQDHSPDGSHWWPAGLGAPSATGGQNGSDYALFPARRRLAVRQDGKIQVYDSGEHDISGFSQHQASTGRSLRFHSQHGEVETGQLTLVG